MAQFDVHENPNPASRKSVPYLLDVQADLLGSLATRTVVPLVASSVVPAPLRHLNPLFNIGETPVVMSTAEIAGVQLNALGKTVCSLKQQRGEIIAALDFLITGI